MRSTIKIYISWILSLLLAASFVFAGYTKIPPGPNMIKRFENWGYNADFALLIGVLEILGAILILIPRMTILGACIIIVLMMGAVYTHLATGIGSPLFAFIYLAMAIVVFALNLKKNRQKV